MASRCRTCSQARRPRSSFTPVPTTSLTSLIVTSWPTGHRVPTRPQCPPVTQASGWRAVSLVPASGSINSGPKRGDVHIDFARSPRPTVGGEWEFALVDAHTRDLSNEATAVIAEIGENPRVHKELLRNTVEVVSGICECAGQAMEDLRTTLGPARRIVRDR